MCVCVCLHARQRQGQRSMEKQRKRERARKRRRSGKRSNETNSSVHFFSAMRCVDDDSVAQEKETERWQEANRKTYGVQKIDRQRERKGERAQESEGRRLGRARNSDQFSAGEQETLIRMRIKIESTTKMTLAPKKPIRIIFFFSDLSNCVCGLFVGGQRRPE